MNEERNPDNRPEEQKTPEYGASDGFFDAPAEQKPSGVPQTEKGGGKKFRLWQRPEKRQKKYSRSFYIALSAMSCALAVIFLMLGFFSKVLLGTGYIIAEIALMVPLAKRFYGGSLLAYVCTVVLAIVFGAAAQIWDLVPFIIFFGLHPIVNCFQQHWQVNKWLAFAVKAVWFDAALFAAYYIIFGGVFGMQAGQSAFFDFVNKYIWLFIIVVGTAFFVLYDFAMFRAQKLVNFAVSKVKK